MKPAVLLLLVIFAGGATYGQPQNLSATVMDAARRTPVEAAVVQNVRTSESVLTDERGRFFLRNTAAADSLSVSALGYEPQKMVAGELKAGGLLLLIAQAPRLSEMLVSTARSSSAALVGKLDLPLRGLSNAQEVLRIVPGLFVGQHAGGGKAEQIFLRGFDVDHGTDVNLSVDGLPVNMVSHAHGQGYADLHFVIPELIENVRFEKGAYEAAKGNFATAGFVEFRTKNRIEQNSIKLEAGQFQTLRTMAQLKLLNTEKQHLYVAGEYGFTNGFFTNPQDFHRLNLLAKYNRRFSRSELTLTGSYFDSRWTASGQIPNRAVASGAIGFFGAIDPAEGGQTARTNLSLQLTSQTASGRYFKNQVYFSRYHFDLFSNFTFFLRDSVNGDQIRQREDRSLFGYTGSTHRTKLLGRRTLTSEAGLQLRFDRVNEVELSRTKDRKTTLSQVQFGDVAENNAAVYVKESLRWNRFLTLTAGLRYDWFGLQYTDRLNNALLSKAGVGLLSPKLHLSFAPSASTEFYLAAGKGFHSNDTRVVLDGRRREALPAAVSGDAGINWKPAKNVFVNAAFWRMQLEQEFVYVGDEGVVEPGGRTLRQGIDLSLRYQPFSTLHLDADLAFAHARLRDEPKGENYIPLAPLFTATGGILYKSKGGWNAALRYRWMDDRPANEDKSLLATGYFLLDANVGYTTNRFALTASVQNLLNSRWKETQFDTESRLAGEAQPVREIHFTPGTPLFLKASLAVFF